MTKRSFQILIILFGLNLFIAVMYSAQRAILGGPPFQATSVRLVPESLRNHSLPAASANISSLGLLRDGCRVPLEPALIRTGGKTGTFFTATYAEPVEATGVYFVTAEGDAGADPVSWMAEASIDNGSSWATVASSSMAFNRDGSPHFLMGGRARPPSARRLTQV
jgi:hypothetical protein